MIIWITTRWLKWAGKQVVIVEICIRYFIINSASVIGSAFIHTLEYNGPRKTFPLEYHGPGKTFTLEYHGPGNPFL